MYQTRERTCKTVLIAIYRSDQASREPHQGSLPTADRFSGRCAAIVASGVRLGRLAKRTASGTSPRTMENVSGSGPATAPSSAQAPGQKAWNALLNIIRSSVGTVEGSWRRPQRLPPVPILEADNTLWGAPVGAASDGCAWAQAGTLVKRFEDPSSATFQPWGLDFDQPGPHEAGPCCLPPAGIAGGGSR